MIASTLLFHALLPLALAAWLALGRPASVVHLVFRLLWIAVYILTLSVAGAGWSWLGLWGRYVVLWLGFACALIGFFRAARKRLPLVAFTTWRERIDLVLSAGLFAILSSGMREIASRRTYAQSALTLRLPLPSGSYAVVHGGRGEGVNAYATAGKRAFSVDLVALGPWMMRARGLTPKELDAYASWDRALLAPCSGDVVEVVTNQPDNPPFAALQKDLPDGNLIVLRCDDANVTLAHLREGSVLPTTGQRVSEGDPIARVGNSGFSSEPHLHIHASRGEDPVPLVFRPGGFLTRNDLAVVP